MNIKSRYIQEGFYDEISFNPQYTKQILDKGSRKTSEKVYFEKKYVKKNGKQDQESEESSDEEEEEKSYQPKQNVKIYQKKENGGGQFDFKKEKKVGNNFWRDEKSHQQTYGSKNNYGQDSQSRVAHEKGGFNSFKAGKNKFAGGQAAYPSKRP